MQEFVGRDAELTLLRELLTRTVSGRGQLVLVSGEPGIGKTRLVGELAARAEAAGLRVAWGEASEDEGSPPFWIFRQLLSSIGAPADPLVATVPGRESADARFEAFESYARELRSAGEPAGLLAVLDDLQWADPASLALLAHLTRGLGRSRLMLVGIFRDTEVATDGSLASTLSKIASEAVARVPLAGLSAADVGRQLAAIRDSAVPPEVAAAVARRTGGNPFFVAEVGRLPSLAGHDLPDAVLDAVRGRLGALDAESRRVLAVAAALGDTLDPAALVAVTGLAVPTVLDALDAARSAGLVTDTDGWRFQHDLIREAARSHLSTVSRLSAHARLAEYLQDGPAASTRASQIAHHWLESLPLGDADSAVRWAIRAADQAVEQFAWERAADLYLRASQTATPTSRSERPRLLLQCAATLLKSGDLRAALPVLADAADAARERTDPRALGAVALAMEGLSDTGGQLGGGPLAEEALAGLPPGDDPLRARLLALQAGEGGFFGHPTADAVSAEALAMAERLGGPDVIRSALRSRQMARSGPDGVAERLELADRMVALGRADNDDDSVLWGRLWRFDALAMLGRIDDAEGEVARMRAIVDGLRRPLPRLHYLRCKAAIDVARGRFDEAVARTREGLLLVEGRTNPSLVGLSISVLIALATLTGREDLVTDPMFEALEQGPPDFVNTVLARYWAGVGDVGRARQYYAAASARVMPVPALLSGFETAIELGSVLGLPDVVRHAETQLRPFADLFVASGAGAFLIWGPVRIPLGVAAAVAGRLDDAVRELRLGADACERAGCPPFAALARFHLAKVLARRGRSGDRAEADALLTTVASTAADLGMVPLRRKADTLRDAARNEAGGPLTPREQEVAGHVAAGLTNKQIAAIMHISERTAETHVQHILTKLGLSNRTQIAAWRAAQPG